MRHEDAKRLSQSIATKQASIAVIGLGYVGLPVAVEFAKGGFKVLGIDKDLSVVNLLTRGRSHILDVTDDDVGAVLNKTFNICAVEEDYAATSQQIRDDIAENDVFIVCVPTPLKKSGRIEPDISFIKKAGEIVKASVFRGRSKPRLVILESTTYPGCTEEHILSKVAGTPQAEEMLLAYSPERTNPGGGVAFHQICKIIGGLDSESFECARELYRQAFENVYPTDLGIRAAETVKCAENGLRFVSLAYASKLAQFSRLVKDLDIWAILSARGPRENEFNDIFPPALLTGNSDARDLLKEVAEHNRLRWEAIEDEPATIERLCEDFKEDARRLGPVSGSSERATVEYLERSFRHLVITFFNQLAKFCDTLSIRLCDVLQAIATKGFGLDLGVPGPGIGGHCIPVDPMYLMWKARVEGIALPLTGC